VKRLRIVLILLSTFFIVNTAYAYIYKEVDPGKVILRVYDHGSIDWPFRWCWGRYYRQTPDLREDPSWWGQNGGYSSSLLIAQEQVFAEKGWTDAEGNFYPYAAEGTHGGGGETYPYWFVVPMEGDVYYMKRYLRYQPTEVIVDGRHVKAPFPQVGDEVAPNKIWGTADVMLESHIRVSLGFDIHARALAWSHPDHDDYVVYDWTVVNTGNVDLDEEIELPNQVFDSLYFHRTNLFYTQGQGWQRPWLGVSGCTPSETTTVFSYPLDDDSLRMAYVYPRRTQSGRCLGYADWQNKEYDPQPMSAMSSGWATLFAPKSNEVPMGPPNEPESDSWAQPHMRTHCWLAEAGRAYGATWFGPGWDSLQARLIWGYMDKGLLGLTPEQDHAHRASSQLMDSLYNVHPGYTFYEQPYDRYYELGYDWKWHFDVPWHQMSPYHSQSYGPYDLEFNDTLRFVEALVNGSVNRKSGYGLGIAYLAGEAANYGWLADMDSAEIADELKKRYPAFNFWPDVMSPNLNEQAKDLMVLTGKDSLFINAMNAQRNFNNNYGVAPNPDPPTRIEIKSLPEEIQLSWEYEGTPSGFKIYSAIGADLYKVEGQTVVGDWQVVEELDGSARFYQDTEPIPGVDYYYSITAVNNEGLESSFYMAKSDKPFAARLTTMPGEELSDIRVVPNPCNISARDVQYPASSQKIQFMNLPPICDIKIYTESGDLVRKISHTDGSGTEVWFDPEGQQFMGTKDFQMPQSGLYFAHIETPDGRSVILKMVIIR